jgi:nucleotide-binding universal stress UspA family protein
MAPEDGPTRRPVVVGVDGSQGSARALAWSLDAARSRQAPLRIVTVWAWGATASPPSNIARQARQNQEALVRAVLAQFPGVLPELCTELVQGDPASALIDRSTDGDLLVLGSQGLSGSAGAVVGSVADACLRHGNCPVVVVPSEPALGLPETLRAPNRRPGLAPSTMAALGLL